MPPAAPPVAVVTGVSRGIGRAAALALGRSGHAVAGVHLGDDEAGAALERELGDGAMVRSLDAGEPGALDAFADEVAERLGGIDVWVNNAARLLVKPFLETTDEDWASLLGLNLLGYVAGCRAAARHMVARGGGRIVNVSSVVADQPTTELSAYVTAKGGVVGLTRALAVELGPHGITVNAVAPGATETPLNAGSWTDEVRATYRERIPLRRIAEPEDVGDAIALFAADGARYVTGQVLDVDGGLIRNGSVGHRRTD